MNPLQKIINGLGEAAPMEKPVNAGDEAMGRYMIERNKQIIFPPYSITRFKSDKNEELTNKTTSE